MGPNLSIFSSNKAVKRSDLIFNQEDVKADPVLIEEDVWLGTNVVVLPWSYYR